MRLSGCSFLVALLFTTATEYSNAFVQPTNPLASPRQRSVHAAHPMTPAVEDRVAPVLLDASPQPEDPDDPDLPTLGNHGIYHIRDAAEHAALVRNFKNQILVVKCYAPWCKACKALEPKFNHLRHDPIYASLPIVWADLTSAHNKDLIADLGVKGMPSIQFFVGGQLRDTFLCGPVKGIPVLQQKLGHLVNACVNVKTRQLKEDILVVRQEDAVAEERKTASMDHYLHFLRKSGRLLQAKATS
jgi:thioredoxin-like negative regulator of GroEL